ncbi:MAG: HIT family protein [Eubacteriales bacterium]
MENERSKKMKDQNCIFCKIANGEIPAATIYEDEDFRAILDLGPATRGHALILPKEHYTNLYELDDEVASKIMVVAKKLVKKMTETLGCEGFNLLQNNGEIAGQTVFHYHLHLIPRYLDDNFNISWKSGELTEEEKADIIARVTG